MDDQPEQDRILFPDYPSEYQINLKDLSEKIQKVFAEQSADRLLKQGKFTHREEMW